jgi:GntR family transcriptional regulator, transcriptional repressor for pyruvate dehydrogenase complex
MWSNQSWQVRHFVAGISFAVDMDETSLQPIPRSPVYEQVEQRLREFIDAEDLKPGDKLMSERDLSARLGVSRTSVRQALTALRVTGVIDIRHGDGVYLLQSPRDLIPKLAAEIVESEVDHPMIWEVREGVEVQAARLAARRRSATDLDSLRRALGDMQVEVDGGSDGIDADRRFHGAIARAAHNPLLLQLMQELSDVVDRTSAASLTLAGRPQISLAAHWQIFDAIDRGDEVAAADAMRDHVETSAANVFASRATD